MLCFLQLELCMTLILGFFYKLLTCGHHWKVLRVMFLMGCTDGSFFFNPLQALPKSEEPPSRTVKSKPLLLSNDQ